MLAKLSGLNLATPNARHRQILFVGQITYEIGPVAQRLEQGTHNPLVPGSNPGGPSLKVFWVCHAMPVGRRI